MTLQEYLNLNGMTASEFADRISRSLATVSRISRGVVFPSPETILEVYHATEGAVQPNDWYNLDS